MANKIILHEFTRLIIQSTLKVMWT